MDFQKLLPKFFFYLVFLKSGDIVMNFNTDEKKKREIFCQLYFLGERKVKQFPRFWLWD
jgi:hypothetical protein